MRHKQHFLVKIILFLRIEISYRSPGFQLPSNSPGFLPIWHYNSMTLDFILLFNFNWRLITLQYCSGFCHTLPWISHGCTCVPHPEPRHGVFNGVIYTEFPTVHQVQVFLIYVGSLCSFCSWVSLLVSHDHLHFLVCPSSLWGHSEPCVLLCLMDPRNVDTIHSVFTC